MRIAIRFCIIGVFLFLPTHVKAINLPSSLESWQVVENGLFDDAATPCLQRDGPSTWDERDGGLGITIDQSLPCQTVIVPKDVRFFGLRRFSLVFTMKITDPGSDHNILILWKDRDNFSNFHLIGQNIEYEKIVDGQPVYSVISRLSLGQQSTHLYRVEHDESTGITRLWRDGKPLFTVIEPVITPELPPSWVGLRAAVGEQRSTNATFVDVRVDDLGETHSTTTPHIRQNDQRWAHLEYNHAQSWSSDKPTIARWGCALTSALMVMQGYGITQLPSGEDLLPHHVNSWLVQQPDGYFGEGHLNWRALTRLASESHDIFGTTKLEFSYEAPQNKLPWLKQTLASGKPVILDLDGHFAVAHQAGAGENDFSLHDPLYPITKLKEYNNDYLSARLFSPSQTDLSAITVIAPLEASLSFSQSDGTSVIATKIPLPPLDGSNHKTLQLFDIAKPHQNVVLRISTSSNASIPLTIFTYSVSGEVDKTETLVEISRHEGTEVAFRWQESSQAPIVDLPLNHVSSELTLSSESSALFTHWLGKWREDVTLLSSFDEAQKWLSGVYWALEQSWKYNWLSAADYQALRTTIQGLIREKFP